jgi:ATP-dependent RNA helicase DHX37/DHR1
VRLDVVQKSSKHNIESTTNSNPQLVYRALDHDGDVFIHPSSVLFDKPPEFLVYSELFRSSKLWLKGEERLSMSSLQSHPKINHTGVTKINSAWLSTLGRSLCSFSKVEDGSSQTPKTDWKVSSTERDCIVIPRFGPRLGLDLAPIRMKQKRVGSRWVFV